MADNIFADLSTPAVTLPGQTQPAASSKNVFADLSAPAAAPDPEEGTPVFLRRNNAFNRFSNIIENHVTGGLNTEIKPAADYLVAAGRRALGYDQPTLTDVVTGKTPPTPADVYHASKQKELEKRDYASNEFGTLGTIAGTVAGLGAFGPSNILRNAAGELVPAVKTAAGSFAPASQVVKDAAGNAVVRDAAGNLVPVAENAGGYLSGVGKAAAVGAPMGFVQGLTENNGTLEERLLDAAKGAGVGAGTGAAFQGLVSPAIQGVGAGVRYARKAVSNAMNPKQAALEAVADRGVEDNFDFPALQQQSSPQPSPQHAALGITPEHTADIVSRGLKGESPATIAQDYGIQPSEVTQYVNNYKEANPTPLNVLELARIQGGPGSGQNTADFARANANLYPQAEMMQRLARRQVEQPQRLQSIIEKAAPGSQVEATQARLTQAMENDAKTKFGQLHAQPDVTVDEDLAKLLTHPLARGQWEEARNLALSDPNAPFEIPSYDEITKTYGIRPKRDLGLNMEGTTGPGLATEARHNLSQMSLDAQIAKAVNDGKYDLADELNKLKMGQSAQYSTKSTGQYPAEVTQPAPFSRTEASTPTAYWGGGAPDRAQSIIGFLRARGGVRPSGETQAVNAERIPGLINSRGMTPDKAREALVEAGFMRENPNAEATTSVADFHDLLGRAVAGEKLVREGDEGLLQAGRHYAENRDESAAMESAARDHLREIGVNPVIYDRMTTAERREIADRIARGSDAGRLEQQARMYFPEGEFNSLSPAERSELGQRIDQGEDPHSVYEELAIRHYNNEPSYSPPSQQPNTEPAPKIRAGVSIPVQALDYFDRALRSNAETAFNQTNGGTLGSALTNIRQRLTNIVDPASPNAARPTLAPGFRDAKASYQRYQSLIGTKPGKEGALLQGQEMPSKLGPEQRKAQASLEGMTPEQQDLFRMGKARQLQDMATTPREGNDAASQYSATGVKQIIRDVFSTKDAKGNIDTSVADRLNAQLGAEKVTVQSLRDLFGNSTTAKQILNQNRIMQGAQTAADAVTGRWHRILENLSLKLTDQIGKRGAAEVLRIVSETDPAQVLQTLNSLAKAAQTSQERQALVMALSQSRSVLPFLAGRYAADQATRVTDGRGSPSGQQLAYPVSR